MDKFGIALLVFMLVVFVLGGSYEISQMKKCEEAGGVYVQKQCLKQNVLLAVK